MTSIWKMNAIKMECLLPINALYEFCVKLIYHVLRKQSCLQKNLKSLCRQ